MIARLDNGANDYEKVIIEGSSDDGHSWLFQYSDSLYYRLAFATVEDYNKADNTSEHIGFNLACEHDTIFAGGVLFRKGFSEINARYIKTESKTIFRSEGMVNLLQSHFLVDDKNDLELTSSIKAIGYKYCMFFNNNSGDYEQQLNFYTELTNEYPQSRYFSYLLANSLGSFKSKEDIYSIYSCFSSDVQESVFGQKINDFIISKKTFFEYDSFEDTILVNTKTNKRETIIQDKSIFNLVVFSASWCSPCHKQIPLLKDIYNKYSDKLELTYISLDREEALNTWNQLMDKESIQWQSLSALPELEKIRQKYYVMGIPHTILIYPGGNKLEILDIREIENYNKLIELINAQ